MPDALLPKNPEGNHHGLVQRGVEYLVSTDGRVGFQCSMLRWTATDNATGQVLAVEQIRVNVDPTKGTRMQDGPEALFRCMRRVREMALTSVRLLTTCWACGRPVPAWPRISPCAQQRQNDGLAFMTSVAEELSLADQSELSGVTPEFDPVAHVDKLRSGGGVTHLPCQGRFKFELVAQKPRPRRVVRRRGAIGLYISPIYLEEP